MKLGVIGYGQRIRRMAAKINQMDPSFQVTAINDVRNKEIREELQKKGEDTNICFYDTVETMLEQAELDGVLIGTRCSLHTDLACKVLSTGLPLFLEKPVSTNMADLQKLQAAYRQSSSQVVVSFPMRATPLIRLAKDIIDSGKVGTIEHVQAANNVPYGGIYYQNWYRDEQETQGLFLQKATHDFDCINYLLQDRPVAICAMKSKQIFKGNKPAGLMCVNCNEQNSCLESAVLKRRNGEPVRGEYCCFAEDTGNEDSGSALIRYQSGMHAAYSQNFFARLNAQKRGALLFGYKGTIEYDLYTGVLQVYMHHTNRVEWYQDDTGDEHHFGGDRQLALNFIDVVKGAGSSESPLDSGVLSALMCLSAKASSETDQFVPIHLD